MKKIALAVLAAPFLSLLFITIHVYFILTSPYHGEPKHFQVKHGEGFSSINYRLSKEELIDNARVFHYYSKLTGSLNNFKVGTYEVTPGMNMLDIIALLRSGKGKLQSITIPEGKNIYEIAQLFKENNIIEDEEEFIELAKSDEMLEYIGYPDAPSVEGFLYPETYLFSPKSPTKLILRAMIDQFTKATDGLNLTMKGLNKYQLITLASIVEKETGAPFERNTIAGIYHNRLNKKMRLQADPTTIYGIYHRDSKFNGNLRKKDLLTTTPFNTYKISGLPLGPICNPGINAIKATLNPEKHNNLYFVSKNDGTHEFTPTYKDHQKAVEKWQKTRSNRKGKSWRDLDTSK